MGISVKSREDHIWKLLLHSTMVVIHVLEISSIRLLQNRLLFKNYCGLLCRWRVMFFASFVLRRNYILFLVTEFQRCQKASVVAKIMLLWKFCWKCNYFIRIKYENLYIFMFKNIFYPLQVSFCNVSKILEEIISYCFIRAQKFYSAFRYSLRRDVLKLFFSFHEQYFQSMDNFLILLKAKLFIPTNRISNKSKFR